MFALKLLSKVYYLCVLLLTSLFFLFPDILDQSSAVFTFLPPLSPSNFFPGNFMGFKNLFIIQQTLPGVPGQPVATFENINQPGESKWRKIAKNTEKRKKYQEIET